MKFYANATRSANDLSGVFEFDDDVAYFYLYRNSAPDGERIGGAIHILSGTPDFDQNDIQVRWSNDETLVGLFIRSTLWAAFDARNGTKYGGNYHKDGQPEIPMEVESPFRCLL